MKLLLGEMQDSSEDLAVLEIDLESNDSSKRWPNTYLLGGSQTGKTNFAIFLASHQMQDGAMVIIDPHGDLAPQVATLAPKDRLSYYGKNNPLPINCLRRNSLNKTQKAKEFAGAINASVDTLNPDQMKITVRMYNILKNAVMVMDDEHSDIKFTITANDGWHSFC